MYKKIKKKICILNKLILKIRTNWKLFFSLPHFQQINIRKSLPFGINLIKYHETKKYTIKKIINTRKT